MKCDWCEKQAIYKRVRLKSNLEKENCSYACEKHIRAYSPESLNGPFRWEKIINE